MPSRKTGTPYSIFLVVFVLVLAAAPFAAVQSANAQSSTETVKIVAHLDLAGIHAKQIFVRNQGDKTYLYLLRPHKHAFAIVDVTRPDRPVIVERAALPQPTGGTVDLPAPGSVLAISVRPDRPSASSADTDAEAPLPTESVRLMDLTDPKHPQTLKTFKNVTSMATDDGRKLVFIANDEGLWIVSHHQSRPLPLCTSDSDEAAFPSCQ